MYPILFSAIEPKHNYLTRPFMILMRSRLAHLLPAADLAKTRHYDTGA